MEIKNEFPPVYNRILEAGMKPSDNVIYTYGDCIYNPSNISLPYHIIIHEEVHCDQQGNEPDLWWDRYLEDKYFRIEQEAEAYAVQFDFLKDAVKDRNQRVKILMDMARILASPIYGSVITQEGAKKLIEDYGKKK